MSDSVPTLALVGVGGFGKQHLINIHRLSGLGKVRLVGLVSGSGVGQLRGQVDADVLALAESVPVHPSLGDYLAGQGAPDVVVISTPIHTHTELTLTALRAGAHVVLEKPPTPGLADFEELIAAAAATGRIVQVGFQSFGSHALPHLAQLLASGTIGELLSVGGVGTWSRAVSYFTRSDWAGRRTIGDIPVVDGVITNPLAHAVATALKMAGATRAGDVTSVTLDQYRANAIECDDTSAVRITTSSGVPVTLGLVLTAPAQTPPRLVAHGSRGSATLHYVSDELDVTVAGQTTSTRFGRTNLTENLLDHLADPAVPLLCELPDTGAFTAVLEAVHTAPAPRPIPGEFVEWTQRDGDTWAVVRDVEQWTHRVAAEGRTFAELGAPWTVAG